MSVKLRNQDEDMVADINAAQIGDGLVQRERAIPQAFLGVTANNLSQSSNTRQDIIEISEGARALNLLQQGQELLRQNEIQLLRQRLNQVFEELEILTNFLQNSGVQQAGIFQSGLRQTANSLNSIARQINGIDIPSRSIQIEFNQVAFRSTQETASVSLSSNSNGDFSLEINRVVEQVELVFTSVNIQA